MNCPLCGTANFYMGLTAVACDSSSCKHYKPPKRVSEEEEVTTSKPELEGNCNRYVVDRVGARWPSDKRMTVHLKGGGTLHLETKLCNVEPQKGEEAEIYFTPGASSATGIVVGGRIYRNNQ